MTDAFGKRRRVVGINLRVTGRPRDGDVGKAAADEFWVNVGIHVDQNAL